MEDNECQIRNVHPVTPRSQKREQQNSGARPAKPRSAGVTGAGSRVSPTSAQNAASGDRNGMGSVVVIMRVMPESPEVDLEKLKFFEIPYYNIEPLRVVKPNFRTENPSVWLTIAISSL